MLTILPVFFPSCVYFQLGFWRTIARTFPFLSNDCGANLILLFPNIRVCETLSPSSPTDWSDKLKYLAVTFLWAPLLLNKCRNYGAVGIQRCPFPVNYYPALNQPTKPPFLWLPSPFLSPVHASGRRGSLGPSVLLHLAFPNLPVRP